MLAGCRSGSSYDFHFTAATSDNFDVNVDAEFDVIGDGALEARAECSLIKIFILTTGAVYHFPCDQTHLRKIAVGQKRQAKNVYVSTEDKTVTLFTNVNVNRLTMGTIEVKGLMMLYRPHHPDLKIFVETIPPIND